MPQKCILDDNSTSARVGQSTFASATFTVMKCSTCGLQYVDAADNKLSTILTDYYSKGEFEKEVSSKVVLAPLRSTIARLSKLYYCVFDSQMRFMERAITTRGGRIVDVGCGDGGLITWLEMNGYDVLGVEPDRNRAERGRKQLRKGSVLVGSIETAHTVFNNYDVLIMSHVLEHLVRPDKVLANLRETLRTSFLFIEVPNCENRSVFQTSLTQPHTYHFTVHSLTKLLTLTGWKVCHMETPVVNESRLAAVEWKIFGTDPGHLAGKEQGSVIRVMVKPAVF